MSIALSNSRLDYQFSSVERDLESFNPDNDLETDRVFIELPERSNVFYVSYSKWSKKELKHGKSIVILEITMDPLAGFIYSGKCQPFGREKLVLSLSEISKDLSPLFHFLYSFSLKFPQSIFSSAIGIKQVDQDESKAAFIDHCKAYSDPHLQYLAIDLQKINDSKAKQISSMIRSYLANKPVTQDQSDAQDATFYLKNKYYVVYSDGSVSDPINKRDAAQKLAKANNGRVYTGTQMINDQHLADLTDPDHASSDGSDAVDLTATI